MEHRKIFQTDNIKVPGGELVLSGPIPPETLRSCEIDPGLDAFRRPHEQLEALIEIAGLPEGRIVAATLVNRIVGYVTFHYPDELERWSESKQDDLIELGAIEVAREFRSFGIGRRLIELAFREGQLDNCIVFTTEYYWHWDLEGSGLTVWQYRKMMERLMKSVDMVWAATDDPEICAHPANCLMIRIGKEVPQESVEKFDRIRFRRRFMY